MLKYFFLLTLALSFTQLSFSQNIGNKKVGVYFAPLIDQEEAAVNGYVLRSGFGFYIMKNTSVNINYSLAKYNNFIFENVPSIYTSYSFIPSIRNEFIKFHRGKLFAQVGFGYGSVKYDPIKGNGRSSVQRESSGGVSLQEYALGANYKLTSGFDLEIFVPYLLVNNITSDVQYNVFSGIAPSVGVTYTW